MVRLAAAQMLFDAGDDIVQGEPLAATVCEVLDDWLVRESDAQAPCLLTGLYGSLRPIGDEVFV
jgi:hypothetical protein